MAPRRIDQLRSNWQRYGCDAGHKSLILRGMICLLLGSGLSLVVLGLLAWRAPRGWQNQDGFHLGDEPNHPNA
jgi:hypothetical protein